jgi:alpha-amylase
MPKVCFYFQLHQPYRLAEYSIFDIGQTDRSYFEDVDQTNQKIFQKVADKSYLPMLRLLLELTQSVPEFRFALSCSGVFLDQAEAYRPEVLMLLQQLAATGQVEFLAETYYHSLASLYSDQEFFDQVKLHHQKIQQLFDQEPVIFRNTELIYSNQIAKLVEQLGYRGILTEAVDRCLWGQARTQLFASAAPTPLPLMLKHAQLSDDIAFRFSDRTWKMYPLHADTYLHWLDDYEPDEVVNLFMDFETFGEHQWSDTGIFAFFAAVVKGIADSSQSQFVTPSTELLAAESKNLPTYDVPEPISWADIGRDLSAWRDNSLQWDSLRLIYDLEKKIRASGDPALLEDWRKLQTSDHFYYMCIKWSADGDVHAYFSPYDDPHDAYNRFTTVMADLQGRLKIQV